MKMPVASGNDCLKVALKIGFEFKRQKGSHLILTKGEKLLIIPLHKTLKKGTLHQILKTIELTPEQFKELL